MILARAVGPTTLSIAAASGNSLDDLSRGFAAKARGDIGAMSHAGGFHEALSSPVFGVGKGLDFAGIVLLG
jgi:hypothetical protein